MPGRRGGSTFDDIPQADPEADSSSERRLGRRRTYNRRREDKDVTPPYFEVFERIAMALERIADLLGEPPPVDEQEPATTVPDPRAEERTERRQG